jgi:hypothetical protein
MFEISKEMVTDIYNEMFRRMENFIGDGWFDEEAEVEEYRKAMTEGIYSSLICLSTNWPEVSRYIIEEEEARRC